MTFTLTVMTHRALGAAAARGATHNDSSSDDWTKDTEELPPSLAARAAPVTTPASAQTVLLLSVSVERVLERVSVCSV